MLLICLRILAGFLYLVTTMTFSFLPNGTSAQVIHEDLAQILLFLKKQLSKRTTETVKNLGERLSRKRMNHTV